MEPPTEKATEPGLKQDDLSGVESPERRSFLGVLIGIGSLGVGVLLGVPLVRFVLHPLLARTTETRWSDAGPIKELESLAVPFKRIILVEQRDGWRTIISEKAIYIIRDPAGHLRALSPVCPHLGCLISWRAGEQHFVCPCHAGIFGKDGERISGPPPRSMDELETKVEDEHLKVRYQYFRQLIPTKEVMA